MRSVVAFATEGPKSSFAKTTIERRDLGPRDASIAIAYAGICHSDIHTARNEWGEAHFPLVPGHEIAGVVDGIGSDVTSHRIGDRVGVGCMVDSCRECVNCLAGEEQYCLNGNVGTYNSIGRDGRSTDGGYSSHTSPMASASMSPLRCCAPELLFTRRWTTGMLARVRGWRSSALVAWVTWA
jgi:uncharacterized zinc-type alcohol dehydrogenase-like protein